MQREPNHRGILKTDFAGVFLALAFALAACGGGGTSSTTATISGTVHAGPVAGASVILKDLDGLFVAGPVTTAGDGSFSVEVPGGVLGEDLVFEAYGGTCTDEASGMATAAGRMAAFAQGSSLSAGSAVHLTAGSTIVANLVEEHGKSRYEAQRSFGAAFGYIPDLGVKPVNAGTGTEPSLLAALQAGAFSQLAADLGLTPEHQFDLLEALGTDLADGTLDGSNGIAPVSLPGGGVLPEDIQNRFEHSLLDYLTNPNNETGLEADKIGILPFAKVALTDSYKVQYIPVDPGASLGRTPFILQVTERSSGDPVSGLDVSLLPVMHMAALEHSTPFDVVTDNGDGTYDCAVYYLMAGGDGWGYWHLNITFEDDSEVESLDLFPTVGSPSYAILRGQEDLVAGPIGDEKRWYYLIDDGLTLESQALGTYGFSLFVAAREDEWDYPALATGVELYDENSSAWSVTAVTVEFSLDSSSWTTMTNEGGGHWSVSGITGLDPDSSELALYVRLNVNGKQKTTDGAAENPSNGFAALITGGASCCF